MNSGIRARQALRRKCAQLGECMSLRRSARSYGEPVEGDPICRSALERWHCMSRKTSEISTTATCWCKQYVSVMSLEER